MATYPDPIPRKNLFTNGDAEAWAVQFHTLRYVLHMSPMQIAQVDYGIDPDHPEAWMAFSWAYEIEHVFPCVDAISMINAAFRKAGSVKKD
ncbi:hypothetical protein LJR257_006785 [Ensifer adhaerens]